MEFSFGDAYKGGPLALGMHKRGSFYDIVDVPECRIVDDDFHTVLTVTLDYFKERNLPYYHKLRHTGYLRHLLVRKAVKTGEILVDLVTTTQIAEGGEAALLAGWKDVLCAAAYQGTLTGVLHTRNDSVADTVTNEGTDVLFGQDHFYEELLGLRFQITPFSFSRRTLWARRCSMRRRGSSSGMPCRAERMRMSRSMEKSCLTFIPEPVRSRRCSPRLQKGDRRGDYSGGGRSCEGECKVKQSYKLRVYRGRCAQGD